MIVWFVRHGPTHSKTMTGWTDLPADLSDHAAVARLSGYLPDAPIVSSDLLRARQTAEAISEGRTMLDPRPDLREFNFGAWEGLAHDAIPDQTLARRFWAAPGELAPPGGESWNAVARRVGQALQALAKAGHPALIIVCHLGPILSQVQRARNVQPRDVLAQRIEPLSVTRITYGATMSLDEVNHRP